MAAAEPNAQKMLTHALDYLAAGYPVFPVCSPKMGQHAHGSQRCTNPGKRPLVAWEPYQSRLPTEAELTIWWLRWPNANIGMATGVRSGVVVLDCDSGAARSLAMERGGLDTTPAVFTGKPGGIHYWLAHPVEEVRNFVAGKKNRHPGLDFRGDGGYVLLPPSIHASGAQYRWVEGSSGKPLAPIPEWLWELLRSEGDATSDAGEAHEALDVEEMLRGFSEGHRDDGLFRFACRLRHDDTPQAYAEILIQVAARNCHPPFDAAEAVRKVRYVYRKYEPGNVGPTLEMDEEIIPPGRSEVAPEAGEDTDEEHAWTVYNAEEFLAIEYPAIEWRVEGYLREKAILFSFGPPGSIKTYVATDAALAIASGGLFLGRFPCQQGRVLIVQEDTLGSDYQQAYLRPMLSARGLTGSDVRDTLFIAPPADFSFDQTERLRDLCNWLGEHKPDLLVIDSFYLMYSGKKEDLITVMKLLKRIRNRFGCAVWIIDHNRKSQGAASVGEDAIDRLINGREKSAAVDVVMESRSVKGESGSVFLDVLKLRGVKLPEPVRVTYADGRLSIDGEEDVSPKGAAQTVYEWLCREGASRTVKQIMAGVGLADRTVRGALSELHMTGLVRPWGGAGNAKTWYGIRRAEAEPDPSPTIDFDDLGEE